MTLQRPFFLFSIARMSFDGGGIVVTVWLSFSRLILNAKHSAGPSVVKEKREEEKRGKKQSSRIAKLSPLGSQPSLFEHVAWVAPDQEDETLNVSG